MSQLALYQIANQLQSLEDLSLEGDIPPDVLADTIEGLEGDFDAKAVQVAKYILSLEASAAAKSAAAEAMERHAKAVKRRADSVRAYLLFQMQSVDRRKVEFADFTIARRANPVAVQVTDAERVPAQFWVQPEPPPKRIDKVLLKKALQAGEAVPGAFIESGERLEVRL
jgi:hypothetical protein